MKTICFGVAAFAGLMLVTGAALGAGDLSSADRAAEVRTGDWAFTLTPRPFQRHPLLDMTAFTEFTAAGKQMGSASLKHPIYYVAQDGGMLDTALIYGHESVPSPAAVQTAVARALASTGYLAADRGPARPKIALVYHYGSLDQLPDGISDLGQNYLLTRANFMAGPKFADELAHKLFLGAAIQGAAVPSLSLAPDVGPAGMPIDAANFFNPVYLMKTFNFRANELLSQLGGDCYYVAISAYDYDALARNRRVLLWRSKLTVDATGVGMAETLPQLIAGSGPYLGQPTADVAIFARRIDRFGRVDVGTPRPVE